MNLKLTRLHLHNSDRDLSHHFKTGISLHCHTQHSREMLDFIPHVAEQLPIISYFWEREKQKYLKREGKEISFTDAYWTPPLSAHNVYDLEKQQINNLNLEALVSITDHDDIEAGQRVRAEHEAGQNAPISLEWTVPFDLGFFHLGVHNLPPERAAEITKDLIDFSFAEKRGLTFAENHLDELFALLNEIPEVLIVLNHPLWDIEMIGKERHAVLLNAFVVKYGKWIHAFEINGFRKWSENKAVLEMADTLGFPVVTGGDRHGCQPNSVVNLSTSRSFGEFAEQIRRDKFSEVILMPHYHQPLKWRQLNSFAEILNHYPNFEKDRQHWIGRVHVSARGNGLKPLSFYWENGGPLWLQAATWTLGALGSPVARPLFSWARQRKDVVPTFFVQPALSLTEAEPENETVTANLSSRTIG